MASAVTAAAKMAVACFKASAMAIANGCFERGARGPLQILAVLLRGLLGSRLVTRTLNTWCQRWASVTLE